MTIYANLYEVGEGKFCAFVDDPKVEIISADPEHDFCQALLKANVPDAEILFYRDGRLTFSHPSFHRMAKVRIAMGETFPHRRVKRSDWTGPDAVKTERQVTAGGDLEAGPCHPTVEP